MKLKDFFSASVKENYGSEKKGRLRVCGYSIERLIKGLSERERR